MLSGRTTLWLFVAVALAAGSVWTIYRHVPPDGGAPRPRLLLATDIDSLDDIVVETGGATLSCQLRQGTWWLTHPIEARADDELIRLMLDTLAARHPVIRPFLRNAQVIIQNEMVHPLHLLHEGDEVQLRMPMFGG